MRRASSNFSAEYVRPLLGIPEQSRRDERATTRCDRIIPRYARFIFRTSRGRLAARTKPANPSRVPRNNNRRISFIRSRSNSARPARCVRDTDEDRARASVNRRAIDRSDKYLKVSERLSSRERGTRAKQLSAFTPKKITLGSRSIRREETEISAASATAVQAIDLRQGFSKRGSPNCVFGSEILPGASGQHGASVSGAVIHCRRMFRCNFIEDL